MNYDLMFDLILLMIGFLSGWIGREIVQLIRDSQEKEKGK